MRSVLLPAALAAILFPIHAVAQRPVLGVTVSPVAAEVAEFLGIEGGLKIDSVTEGRGAEKAGMQANDLLIQVGDRKSITLDALREELSKHEPGDHVSVTVLRRGERRQMRVELSASEEPVLEDVTEVFEGLPPAGAPAPMASANTKDKAKAKASDEERQIAKIAERIAAARQRALGSLKEHAAEHKEVLDRLLTEEFTAEHREHLEQFAKRATQDAAKVQAEVERSVDLAMREARRAMEKAHQALQQAEGRQNPFFHLYPGGEVAARDPVALVPSTPLVGAYSGQAKQNQERLEAMQDRLARIEDRLERIEALLRDRRDR